MSRYDLDRIKAELSIPAVLVHYGVTIHRNRARCPLPGLCEGKAGEALSIFASGQAFACHRCQAKGSAIELIRIAERLSIGAAIQRAAVLAGVAPMQPGSVVARLRTNPAAERLVRVGRLWRAVSFLRDRAQAIRDREAEETEIRLMAAHAYRRANRALDAILAHDETAVDRLLEELQP